MDTDRNLLFGVLALQADLLDNDQFAEACSAWAARKDTALADLLVERGWLTPSDRADVDKLLQRKLAKHGGDAKVGLAEVTTDQVRQSLAGVEDADVRQSLAGASTPPQGPVLPSTIAYVPAASERYTLTRLHATGGIGRVWLARDASLGRDVALKELRRERAAHPAVVARFLREAQVTGQLEHPGVVPVYEVGRRPDDQPFYTMRFVRGRTLAEAVAAYHGRRGRGAAGPLELRELLTAFVGVCQAVAYAHSRGVLHRDLKPQNVVLGDYGEVIVLDWGLAKVTGESEGEPAADRAPVALAGEGSREETVAGQVLGTPAYMAPEQAEGRLDLLDARTDVYGLGAVLYEVLSGQAPFHGGGMATVLRQVVHDAPAPPRAAVPAVPRALEAVCLQALARRPADRYPTVLELAGDVKRYLADEPVSAYRDPLTTRLTRWGRRHRTLATSGGVLAIALIATLAVGAALINRERVRADQERARAEENFREARAAVDRYFTTVSESRLLDVPGLQPLRKELLDAAEEYYRDFLQKRSDDPSLRAEAATASFRVGWINQAIGRRNDALEPLKRAVSLYQKLAHDFPDVAEYRRLEALGHGSLGLVQASLGQHDEALKSHRNALALREELVKAQPDDLLARNDLARSRRNIGDVYRILGKPDEAFAEWDQALAIHRELLRAPDQGSQGRVELSRPSARPLTIVREDLGRLLIDRAFVLRERGRKDEAGVALAEARELLEALLRERPGDLGYRGILGGIFVNLGTLDTARGRYEDAERWFRSGIEIFERLAAANPTVADYRSGLAESEIQRAWVLVQLGRSPEAQSALRKSIAIAEGLLADEPGSLAYGHMLARALTPSGNQLLKDGKALDAVPMLRRSLEIMERIARERPGVVHYRATLANSFRGVGRAEAAAGHPVEARDMLEKAINLDRPLADLYPVSRYNLACDLALLIPVAEPGRREALAVEAVEVLRTGISQGYPNVSQIKADHDLDTLQSRPDFQSLLTASQTGPAPGK
jgi:serine/threonine-protein kinase